MHVKICGKCGLIHPDDYTGQNCKDPECGGKVVLNNILFPLSDYETEDLAVEAEKVS